MRICVVRLGGMGDILLATPTLRALAAHYQTDQVDFVVGPGMEAAVTGLPYAARILAFDRKKHWGAGLPGFGGTGTRDSAPPARRPRASFAGRGRGGCQAFHVHWFHTSHQQPGLLHRLQWWQARVSLPH